MAEPSSLDDRVKQATLDKLLAEVDKLRSETLAAHRAGDKSRAEALKLRCEARALSINKRTERYTEPLKVFGAAILGAGGVVAALTQYQVADLKAEAARKARDEAQAAYAVSVQRQGEAEAKAATASALAASAAARREAAEKLAQDAVTKAEQARGDMRVAQAAIVTATQARETLARDIDKLKVELSQTQVTLTAAKAEASDARSTLEKGVLDGLQPSARDLAGKLLSAARSRGIPLTLVAGYRSPEQQLALYAKGRDGEGGNIVTHARVSVHTTGLAFDVAFKKGDVVTWDDAQAFRAVGAIGKELGLKWGGDWRLADPPHFETQDAQDALKKLIADAAAAKS